MCTCRGPGVHLTHAIATSRKANHRSLPKTNINSYDDGTYIDANLLRILYRYAYVWVPVTLSIAIVFCHVFLGLSKGRRRGRLDLLPQLVIKL